MKINKSDAIIGGNSEIPAGIYRVRVTKTDKRYNEKWSCDMTELKCEIIEPEVVMDPNGREISVAGRQFSYWLMHTTSQTWGQAVVNDFCTRLDVAQEEEYDTDLHKEYFLGMEFDAILSSEEDFKRKPKQPGQKVGDFLLDGEGKKISNGFRVNANLSDVLPNCRPSRNESIAF